VEKKMKIKTTENLIEETAVNLLRLAVVRLPQDVKDALQRAHREEMSETGKIQLEAILKNIALAEKENVPLCQDTGIIAFHVKAGTQAKGLDKIESSLKNATRIATTEIPLRPNAVDPFTQKNSGDNTGRFVPIIYWELTQGDAIEITACPKGGGSENV
jgi:fumarate hydratase subunit alpha